MEKLSLNASMRTALGKQASVIRRQDMLPAVLYGHGLESLPLQVDRKDFLKIFKKAGESTIITLDVDGKQHPVLIQGVQEHFLHNQPIHVDFYAIRMDEKLTARIPIRFLGESPAVKNLGGILFKNLSEVEVECLPADLPPYVEVDISGLNSFEDMIRIADLKVSDKVKILVSQDSLVVNVNAPRSEAELAELEQAPVAEDVTKVEGVVKPETEEGAAEEEGEKKAETEESKEKQAPKEKAEK